MAGYEVVVYEEYAPLAQDFTDVILNAQKSEPKPWLGDIAQSARWFDHLQADG